MTTISGHYNFMKLVDFNRTQLFTQYVYVFFANSEIANQIKYVPLELFFTYTYCLSFLANSSLLLV